MADWKEKAASKATVEDVVHDIIRGAVDVERRFICEALSCDLIGMNSDLMTRYIEFVADRLLIALGHSKLFGSSNPFDWMELMSLLARPILSRSALASIRRRA